MDYTMPQTTSNAPHMLKQGPHITLRQLNTSRWTPALCFFDCQLIQGGRVSNDLKQGKLDWHDILCTHQTLLQHDVPQFRHDTPPSLCFQTCPCCLSPASIANTCSLLPGW